MKSNHIVKRNRIALISIAVAALVVCSSFNAFAAAANPPFKVVYSGNNTSVSVTPTVLDTFTGLMPGQTTDRQDILIQNNSGQKLQVYFRAQPTAENSNPVLSQKLLDTLILKITFKMDDNAAEQTLYEGPASGKTGTKDIVTNPIALGYVYENSTSGVLSAVLTVPPTMENQFQNVFAKIAWNIQFDVPSVSSKAPGGGGGGGGHDYGGGGTEPTVVSENESINPDSTPRTGPDSSSPSSAQTETVGDDEIPLSHPPKTGENASYLWIIVAAAVTAALVFLITRRKIKSQTK
ncbi:LPXTG cell wall anchor domain-containing protein [Caproiciproducens galactitolivorans]|uniref:LPXTG cell wall anchor domain-containing protein n=1 Tax=Caproiciproducens galactitolivorans TaxID=642589 RepID=A0ABT4BTA0_9FIRM|nr:LPXTG cell wall anchor domain-containing protein [Caproiciproducens galactitolivorans]MCY1714123.1 LPXTG cell wall anchor domain-containing protein [Caproiciproducens galactitolivorans]